MNGDQAIFPREAVGAFHDISAMQAAIDELLTSGFNHGDLSVLGTEEAVAEKSGLSWRTSKDLEDNPAVPTKAYVSPESFADAQGALIGTLLYIGAAGTAAFFLIGGSGPIGGAILASAVAGGIGGGIGGLLGEILKSHRASELAFQLAHGGLLLWVRTRTPAAEEQALEILRRHGCEDAHVHNIVPMPILKA